jgi:hypothetical protein
MIAAGYDDFGLDKEYLEKALEASWDAKQWTQELRNRWHRKGRPHLTKPNGDKR